VRARVPKLRLSSLSGAEVFPLLIPGETGICNPSIAASDQGFRCIIRSVNYDLGRDGRVRTPAVGTTPSFNLLADLDANFRIVRIERIDDSAVGIDRQPGNRLEDCRLFRWKDDWWFSASWALSDESQASQMALCRLVGSRVAQWHLLSSPVNFWIEKNWMPCVDGNLLRWVYWIDPMQVLTFSDGELSYERKGRYGRLDGWAGSSPLVRYRDNWLCAVHYRQVSSKNIAYVHRFVELTDDFEIRRVSPRFSLEGQEMEFCGGLCLTSEQAILSYGVWDRHARVMRVDIFAIESMLHPYRIPRSLAVAVSETRRGLRPWIRHRWVRQPGKQLRALKARWLSRD